MICKAEAALFSLGVLFIAGTASAETIELVTYYPSQATTGILHVDKLTVGSGYNSVTPDDGQAFIFDRLGIGPNFTAVDFPAERLEVEGSILASPLAGSDALFIADRAANNRLSGLRLNTNGIMQWTVGSRAGTEHLQVFSEADSTARLLIEQGTGNVGIGTTTPTGRLHVVGVNDALSKILFMPGADTAAAGTPEIRVGIGTNSPQELAHVAGNLRVDGQLIIGGGFNAEQGVFIDNLFVGKVIPDFHWTDISWTDIRDSVKTVNLPAGIAAITYSLAAFSNSGFSAQGAFGAWIIKVKIGANESPDQLWFSSFGGHESLSGSWVTNVAGGNTTIKLQVRNIGGGYPQSFYQNVGDYVTWTLVVYKS